MNIETLREHCLAVKGAEECMPFDDDTMVYKVMGKMFAYYALTPKNGEFWVVMKCNPERAMELREQYHGIFKGYHSGSSAMWNTIDIQSDVPDRLIVELIAHSVDEVIKKLPKYKQQQYRVPV
ncbi:MAG: MmcQ/YjbR family DNA-binding protein [Bacteroidales bacterium]|jgi:predicted DNA-binding protein (MmcQ/YjbR family)|nr:MmcQ/YjbR family DNA-binding protein [Bacteroidales bacterium]